MNSFVSPPPLNPAEIQDPAPADVVLQGDAFWPDIDLVDLRAVMRVDPNVDIARLRDAAIEAVLSVRRELAPWKALQLAAGVDALEDVPGEVLEGIPEAVYKYTRAVYSGTAADLLERLRDLGMTNAGQERGDELEATAGAHRRAERVAIRDMIGAPRITAELV